MIYNCLLHAHQSSMVANLFLQNHALLAACRVGDVMAVASYLNSGADVQTNDEVCSRIHNNSPSECLTVYFQYSTTPVFHASHYSHLQVVRLLICRGAEVDYRSTVSDTTECSVCKGAMTHN